MEYRPAGAGTVPGDRTVRALGGGVRGGDGDSLAAAGAVHGVRR